MKGNHSKTSELLDLITQQSLYINQLETTNVSVKEELQSFKKRLSEVIAENQSIHDGLRCEITNKTINVATDVIEHNASHLFDDQLPTTNVARTSAMNEEKFNKWKKEIEKSREIFKAQVEGLEAENKITKRDLEEALRENDMLRETVKKQDNLLRMPASIHDCQQRDLHEINANIPIIERLTKERDDLAKTIASLRNTVMTSQEKEGRLRLEVHKSIAAVEDMQLEKSKVEIDRERISKDLELTKSRLDQEISDTHRRSHEAALNERKACRDEIEELNKTISELHQSNNVYENRLEEAGRSNTELKGQLDESRKQLLLANQDLGRMRSEVEHEVKSALKGYKSAEDELRETRSKLEHELLKNRQERARLEQSATDVQTRLTDAQNDALKCREINVTLSEEINMLKQELQSLKRQRDSIVKQSEDEIANLSRKMQEIDAEANNKIKNMQFGYETRLTELEKIGVKQSTLNQRLRDEGKQLQDALAKLTKKYRKKVGDLAHENEFNKAQVERLTIMNQDMEEQIVGHGITHRQMKERLLQLEERANFTTGHAASAMEERDRIACDRDLLDREVKFLQSQIMTPGKN